MAINYTYPAKGSPVRSDEFLIIDSADNSTKKVTVDNILSLGTGEDVGVSSLTAVSPISNIGTATEVNLTLDTVPVAKGGTGLTAIGTPHQVPTVNEAGTALEYKDTTIIETVKNSTASTILKGTPLHATGWNEAEGVPEVEPANATNGNTDLMPCIGLAENDIPAGQIGHSLIVGVLEEIRTNGYSVDVGDVLYVAPGGGLTGTRPTGTNIIQPVAVILKLAGVGAGVLQVATVSQGASIPNVQNSQIIVGDASNVGQSVAMSGEVSISNTGVTAVTGIAGNVSIQGYSPLITKSDASFTIESDVFGKTVLCTAAGTTSISITDNSEYPVGSEVELVNFKNAGSIEVAGSGGTSLSGGTTIEAIYGKGTLKKAGTNSWIFFGQVV